MEESEWIDSLNRRSVFFAKAIDGFGGADADASGPDCRRRLALLFKIVDRQDFPL